MAQVGDSAYTQHGLGQITEIINERGRRSFRVSGRGFHVWVDETRLHVAKEHGGLDWAEGYTPDEGDIAARKRHQHPESGELAPGESWGGVGDYWDAAPTKSHYSGLETTIDQGGGSVNKDNHTTLPYNPSPQYSVDLFRRDQNIQPGENEIDPDERLHPADSVSFDSRTDPGSPQPSSSLFASPGGGGHFDTERTSGRHDAPAQHMVPMDDVEYQSYLDQDPGYSGGAHETYNLPKGAIGGSGFSPDEPVIVPNRSTDLGDSTRHAAYRPAGLSDRYARFEIEADDHDSPVAQFRRDPVGYIRMCGHLWTDGDDSLEKFADYTQLIDIDPRMRQAAWTDVRRKAMRLRHEGNVQVNDHGAGRIYATVKGDNGTYDVMIVKGGSYGGMGGGQSVTDWACSCPWGRWAFKRQMSYVGRLCSHGYATYLTMQSKDITPEHFQKKGGVDDYKSWLKDNDQSPEPASVASYVNVSADETTDEEASKLYDYALDNPDESPERDYDIPYTEDPEKAYKQADVLRNKPQSLTPSLHEVPDDGEEVWSDVEKDERETTGPDDIVHFSSRNTMRRLHAQPTGDGTGGLALPTGSTAGASAGDMSSPDAPPVQPPSTAPFTPTASNFSRLAATLHHAYEPDTDPTTHEKPTVPKGWGPGGSTELHKPKLGPSWGPGGNTQINKPKLGPSWGPGGNTEIHKPKLGPSWGHGGDSRINLTVDPPGGKPTPAPAPANDSRDNELAQSPQGRLLDDRMKGTAPPPAPGQPPAGQPAGQPPAGQPPAGQPPAGQPPAPTGQPPAAAPAATNSPWTATPGLDAEGKNAINTPEYKVNRGDTLNTILERSYGKDNVESKKQEVMKANGIQNADMIQADSTMKLPGADQYDSLTGKPGAKVEAGPAATPTTTPKAGPGQETPPGSQAERHGESAGQPPGPAVPAPAQPGLPPSHASLRYADTSDSSLLDKLRDLSRGENHEDCLGDMEDHNDELRDVVDELNDRGYDASFMVAAFDPNPGGNFLGQSEPDWANEPFAGSGPAPKDWITDSETYVDEHEHYADDDWHEDDGSDIIKFNDGRSKPQQGPGKSSHYDRLTASLHYADEQSEGEGMFNPDNPSDQDWNQADPMQLVHQIGQQVQKLPEEVLGMAVGKGMGKMLARQSGHHEMPSHPGRHELHPGTDLRVPAEGFSVYDANDWDVMHPEDDEGPSHHAAGLAPLARRSGRGPVNPPRIDPGVRQPGRVHAAAAPPEDFGYDGGADDSAYLDSPDGGDIVAAFQRSGAAAAVMGSGSSGSSDGDIAAHAQAFLRTAGRKYTPDEQRELEAEFHPQGARNLPTDEDLAGTHYLLGL